MRFLSFLLFFTTLSVVAQSRFEAIEDNFEDFAELTREQIFTHTNKSTFITGESVWFKTYIFSRDLMRFSDNSSNIYCVLYDPNNKPVKKKMLMGVNGVANGEFMLDSTFSSGEYVLKTYTNWSKNFKNEYLHHESKLKILNSDKNSFDKTLKSTGKIDVQFLPESGHLLANTLNKLGVIAKDSLGKAVKNLRVTLYENSMEMSEVTLNHLGINVFNFVPKKDMVYTATYFYYNEKYNVQIPVIEPKGVILQTNETDENVEVSVKTNENTLPDLMNKPFKVTVHNTVDLMSYNFIFQDSPTQVFTFGKNELFPGVNIFTLFDIKGNAIAERIFFNYEGLKLDNIDSYNALKENDSIAITLNIKGISDNEIQSLSASILPSETKSYRSNDNIISSFLVKPYLKGTTENLKYFFTDITTLKKKELNQLLLTQGWSRYSWDAIFNQQPELIYDIDYGVNYRISSNSKKEETYLIYPNINSKSELISLKPNSFEEKLDFFPLDEEFLRIGQVQNNKKLGKANLIVNFEPKEIPTFNNVSNSASVTTLSQLTNQGYEMTKLSGLDKTQELDEVKIIARKEYTRLEKLQNKNIGKVYEFDEKMKRFYKTFAQFISSYGFVVELGNEVELNPITGMEEMTLFRIETRNPSTINGTKVPRIFLDDVYLSDYDFLSSFTMETVDYVIINKGGIGEGLRGSAGVIRIYTDPNKRPATTPKNSFSEYKIPLKFSLPKQFYSPKYSSIKSVFFSDYGAIDWKPNLKFENGKIEFKVLNTGLPLKIFIEGVVNSDTLISEIIKID